jgi:hypothetical protein
MFLGIGRFKLCQLYYTNTQIQFLPTFPIAKNHCLTLIWRSPLLPSGHIIASDLNIINHAMADKSNIIIELPVKKSRNNRRSNRFQWCPL